MGWDGMGSWDAGMPMHAWGAISMHADADAAAA